MEVMEKGYSAEEIKKAIENIVNLFKFDKSKVKCIFIFYLDRQSLNSIPSFFHVCISLMYEVHV